MMRIRYSSIGGQSEIGYNGGMAGTEGWVEEYWERGFVTLRGVFPQEELDILSQGFEEILAMGQGFTETTKHGLAEFRVIPIDGKPTLKFAKWASSIHGGLN
nr:hypothetical protein [Fibrobacterota bacterium]